MRTNSLWSSIALLALVCNVQVLGLSKTRPNFVFILTDDQDALFNSSSHMSYLQRHVVNEGITFESAYVATPICCARYMV